MASIYSSKSTYGWQLRLDYTVSQSVANNKSTLSLALYIYDGTGESYNQAANSCYYTIQGTRTYNPYSYTDAQKNTWIKLGTKTVEVAHAADGTGSVTLSADWHSGFTSQWTPASLSLSQSVTLPTIPRASTMTVSNGTLGTELNMTISRASSSFTHTITYTCGSASGTITSKTSSTSVSWSNPPVALAAQDTKASAVTVTLTLDTYNGSTKIGSKTYTIKMTVPASVKPTVGTLRVSCPQEHVTTYGGYVQGKSTVEVEAPTVTLGQGSAIVSRQIKIGTKQTINAASGTSATLQETGTVTITYTVTDERGRSGSNTTTITVQPYAAPQITTCTAVRCQQDGTEDAANGTNIKVAWAASVSSLGGSGNSGTAKLYWRETGDSSWTEEEPLSGLSGDKILDSKSTSKSYEVYITVTDSLGTVSRAITVRVASGRVLFATTPEMDGLSLGRSDAVSGLLRLAWGLEVEGGLRNAAVEGSILDFALAAPLGLTPIYTGKATTDLPTVGGSFSYSVGFVQRRVADQVFLCLLSYTTAAIATNSYLAGRTEPWTGWAIADPCVAWGTSGIWTYRKWASGVAECWGVQTGLTANLTTQWGSSGLYYNSGDGKAPDFPFAFAAKPAVTVSVENGSGVSLIAMTNGSGGSTTKAPAVQLCRAGSASSVAYTLHWHVVGRWK